MTLFGNVNYQKSNPIDNFGCPWASLSDRSTYRNSL